MSNHIPHRKPAFSTLRPSPLVFIPASEDEASLLLACVGPGQILRRKETDNGPTSYFVYQKKDGSQIFLKLVPAAHAERQRAADTVASWVGGYGVSTSMPLKGYPKALDDGRAVFAYDYVVSRFAHATVSDLVRIGESLAAMHAALSLLPNAAEIRRASASRTEMLVRRCNAVGSGEHSPGPRPEELRQILEKESGLFALLNTGPSQPLHGDLVYGNILVSLKTGAPVILDFEDALISCLPVDLDIALVLERFVLLPEPDDEVALALGREMLRAYGRRSGKGSGILAHPIYDCLRLLSVRALTTLAEFESQGGAVELAEWNKFFGLYQMAEKRMPLLRKLENEFHD